MNFVLTLWVSSQRKFKLFHWVRARTRLNKRILGYLGACARGPKEKNLSLGTG